MTRYEFEFVKNPTECEEFAEASAHELRVLVALFSLDGTSDEDELVKKSAVSRARLASALALWQGAGVIALKKAAEASFYGNKVEEEFSERIELDALAEESSLEVAKTIRDRSLASLFAELAAMQKRELTHMETKRIASLISQCNLSEEYILILAAYMKEEGNLSVLLLVKRAMTLAGEGISTAEALESYIAYKETDEREMMEYRRIFGVYGRSFSKKEKELLGKWSKVYGYGTEIVGMAYDISTLHTSKLSLPYMDTLLTDWHSHGAKTLSECEARYAERKAELDREEALRREETSKRRGGGEKKKNAARYGDFDPEEVFRLALDRSYSDSGSESKT